MLVDENKMIQYWIVMNIVLMLITMDKKKNGISFFGGKVCLTVNLTTMMYRKNYFW